VKITISRLYKYRDTLIRFRQIGMVKVFSDDLAEDVNTSSTQVRKDFSLFGLSGNKKGGYVISELIAQLDKLLGKDKTYSAIIVGAGNLGKALMNYNGFEEEGFKIVAVFDIDPLKTSREGKVPVLPAQELEKFIKANRIGLGIIAVPYFAAQEAADKMTAAGIKGILNFAPVSLKVPGDCFVNNINVRLELETVNYFAKIMNENKKNKNGKGL
jgi:redox-sensing transcriptional repressor